MEAQESSTSAAAEAASTPPAVAGSVGSTVTSTAEPAVAAASTAAGSVQDAASSVEPTANQALSTAQEAAAQAVEPVKNAASEATQTVEEVARQPAEKTVDKAKEAVSPVTKTVKETLRDATKAPEQTVDTAKEAVSPVTKTVEQTLRDATKAPEQTVDKAKEAVSPVTKTVEQTLRDATKAPEQTVDTAKEAVSPVTRTVKETLREATETGPRPVSPDSDGPAPAGQPSTIGTAPSETSSDSDRDSAGGRLPERADDSSRPIHPRAAGTVTDGVSGAAASTSVTRSTSTERTSVADGLVPSRPAQGTSTRRSQGVTAHRGGALVPPPATGRRTDEVAAETGSTARGVQPPSSQEVDSGGSFSFPLPGFAWPSFLPSPVVLARWLLYLMTALLICVAALLASGFWARHRVLKF